MLCSKIPRLRSQPGKMTTPWKYTLIHRAVGASSASRPFAELRDGYARAGPARGGEPQASRVTWSVLISAESWCAVSMSMYLVHADASLKFPHRTSGGPTNWYGVACSAVTVLRAVIYGNRTRLCGTRHAYSSYTARSLIAEASGSAATIATAPPLPPPEEFRVLFQNFLKNSSVCARRATAACVFCTRAAALRVGDGRAGVAFGVNATPLRGPSACTCSASMRFRNAATALFFCARQEPVISTALMRCVVVICGSAHLFARGTHVA